MKIYDVSLPISQDLPVWPGDPPVELERIAAIADGSDANVSRLACGVHVGTHIDAPLHFFDGTNGVDQIDLTILTGRVHVVDMRGEAAITRAKLEALGLTRHARRVIFKTDNSQYWQTDRGEFVEEFVALEPDAARWLVDRGIQLVGIDYLSIAPYNESVHTHRILLESGIVIVEGLDLSSVEPGRYTLYCLPIKLVGSDGAPARVILVGP